jgi:hypothetical protein
MRSISRTSGSRICQVPSIVTCAASRKMMKTRLTVRCGLSGRGDRHRVGALRLRAARRDDDVLECRDRLRRAVLRQLEFLGAQIHDGLTVFRGIDIDAHVVRLRADRWLPLLRISCGRQLGGERDNKGSHGDGHTEARDGGRCGHVDASSGGQATAGWF